MPINIGATGTTGRIIGGNEIYRDSNLKLYLDPYRFECYGDTGSSTLSDLSGNNYDFTIVNSSGRYRGHLYLDGSDDYAYLDDTPDLEVFDSPAPNDPDTGHNDFTIQIWAKVTSNTDSSWFFSKVSTYNTLYLNKGYQFFYHKDLGCCVFGLSAANSLSNYTYVISAVGTTDILNNWANVAVSVNRSSNAIIYVNGVQEVSTSISSLEAIDCSNDKHVYIGGRSSSGTQTSSITHSFTGYMGPVLFYRTALTVDQINQNFNVHRGIYGI